MAMRMWARSWPGVDAELSGVVTDTPGLLLAEIGTAASVSDGSIGIRLFGQAKAAPSQLAAAGVDTGLRTTVVEHRRTRHQRPGRGPRLGTPGPGSGSTSCR